MDIGRTLPAGINRDLADELLTFKSLYETLARCASDCIVEVDSQGCIARFNYAAESLTGYSAPSMVGRSIDDLIEGPAATLFTNELHTDVRTVGFTVRDTQAHPIAVRGRIVSLSRDQQIDGWLVSFAPVRKVREIEQLKNELVSTVSHELKTPLSAIKAYTATLRANPELYDGQREEFLAIIEQQADRLSRLIDDMLLVTRVNAEQLLRRRVEIALDTILNRIFSEIAFDAQRHSVARHTAGVTISGDPERLHDIFRNIIENALKYSPAGGKVTIAATASAERTVVDIRDEGVGIPDEHLPYIFDRFYRVDSELTASVGGSGLGLFIVHALVRAHGGTIDVRSIPDSGTTFTLTFPVRA
ncbi:MAG TPA: PAS domain-containing sensor histidine kinase [Candidatus Baltobacteraceae bacterium]|jgi:PAS domain S-box-containing protein